jgi:hypothetical protein
MITGFNTDVQYDGCVYHVQTEDRGMDHPVLESLVYVGGTIIAKKQTPYGEHLKQGATEEMIASLLRRQHQVIIKAIRSGRIEDLSRQTDPDKDPIAQEIASGRTSPSKTGEQKTAAKPPASTTAERKGVPKPPASTTAEHKIAEKPRASATAEPESPARTPSSATGEQTLPAKPPVPDASGLKIAAPPRELPRSEPRPAPTAEIPGEPSLADAPTEEIPIPAEIAARTTGPTKAPVGAQPQASGGRIGLNLDQVISDYLKRSAEQGRLDLSVVSPNSFVAGKAVNLKVQVCRTETPEAEAIVTVKIIGTAFKPQVHIARADRAGIATFNLNLPSFNAGTAAIVIEAQSNRGRGELKHLIRRA